MRKIIKSYSSKGKFVFDNEHEFENIKCNYQYDLCSNKNMKGYVEIPTTQGKFINSVFKKENRDCNFFGKYGLNISGVIRNVSIDDSTNISFDITEIKEKDKYEDGKPNLLNIYYFIPFILNLSRGISSHYKKYSNIILKYNEKEFVINTSGVKVKFQETLDLKKHKKPDYLLYRFITPVIQLNNNIPFTEKQFHDIMQEIMLILSLIYFKRFNVFGYRIEYLNNNKLLSTLTYRYANINCGKDFTEDCGYKFNEFFKSKNISNLVKRYNNLENNQKERFKRIVNNYLVISEDTIFETKFKNTYIVLCAISKLIIPKLIIPDKNKPSDEDYIKKACVKAKVILSVINFKESPNRTRNKNSKLEWLISEYRNELIHFNYDKYKQEEVFDEYIKMMHVLRKLIIFYLNKKLMDFPYPKDKFNLNTLEKN